MTWEQKRQISYNYLEKHKDEISTEAYMRIFQTIGSQAIENIFATEKNIIDMIMIENGEISADELVSQYINGLKVS